MRIREWGLIALASTAIAVGAGIVTARILSGSPKPEALTPPPLPALYIPEDKADLGEVWETNDAVLTVPICNSTDRDIEILDFETSCDCGEVSPRKLTVPAKGTATVQVIMDLTRRTPQQIGMVRRKFSLKIKPVLARVGEPRWIECSWIARSAITLNHTSVDFGDLRKEDATSNSRTLIATSHEPIVGFLATCESSQLILAVDRIQDGKWAVRLSPASNSPIGSWEAKVRLDCSLMSGDKNLIEIRVSGRNLSQ